MNDEDKADLRELIAARDDIQQQIDQLRTIRWHANEGGVEILGELREQLLEIKGMIANMEAPDTQRPPGT